MKKVSIFLVIISVLSILILSGCTYEANISTELCINDDMSGYRKMYCQYSNTPDNSNTVTDETIAEVIGNAIADTPFEYSKTSNGHELLLSFTSIEDYKQKVGDIFKNGDSDFIPDIAVTVGDNASVYENFSSTDLLENIIEKCNEYIAKTDSTASLNVTADTSRLIMGNRSADIPSGEINYRFDTLKDAKPAKISLLNKVIAPDTLNRTIGLIFDDNDIAGSKAYIDSEITSKLSNMFAELHWDGNTLFIECEGNPDSIKKITEAVLGCTDELSLELSSEGDLTLEKIQLNEKITFFSETEFDYCIENKDNYAVEDIWGRTNIDTISPEKDGGAWNLLSSGSTLEIGCSIEHRTYAQQVYITLQNKGNGIYMREYYIVFEDVSSSFLISLSKNLDERASESICRIQDGVLFISFEGDVQRINDLADSLFGSENKLTLESDFSPFDLNSSFTLRDNILLSAEIYTAGRTDDINYRYIPFDEKLSSPTEFTLDNGSVAELKGSISNQYALLMLALLALAIVLIMLLTVLSSRRRKLRRTPKTALPPGGYMTSKGVMVLPSSMAVKREEKQTADIE